MTRGFLLGAFMPPHRGHVMLCDFAQRYCDDLTILVVAQPGEPIDGRLRRGWMQELYPKARIAYFEGEVPQLEAKDPDFWARWAPIITAAHPESADFVFSSDPRGSVTAEGMGARFVPFDPQWMAMPLSTAEVRANPYAAWQFLPAPVRAHFVRSVAMFGPESTGKTTLARALAEHYQTIAAPEYGRTYCEIFGNECNADDLRKIVMGNNALEHAARRRANRLLILDTDAVLTAVWATVLLGTRPPDLDRTERVADFYLLADIDVPFEKDGIRYWPEEERRKEFFDLCVAELQRRELPYALVSGDRESRMRSAVAAISRRFPDIAMP